MGSLHKNIQLMLELLKIQFLALGPILFLPYINDLSDDVICNIAIYAGDTTLYSKCRQVSDLWEQLELASELLNLNLICESLWTGAGYGLSVIEIRNFHATSEKLNKRGK